MRKFEPPMLSVASKLWIGDAIPTNRHVVLAFSLLRHALNAVANHYLSNVHILMKPPLRISSTGYLFQVIGCLRLFDFTTILREFTLKTNRGASFR